MIRFLTAFCVAFLIVGVVCLPSPACPPAPVYRSYTPTYHQTYTPAVVAVYQPVPVAVPVFAVGYAPPAVTASSLAAPVQPSAPVTSPAPAPAAQPAAVAPPSAGAGQLPQPAAQGGAGIVALNAKCASCHESNVAQGKGKGFVLLQGSALVPLTEAQRLKCLREVLSGRMPRGGKLTDEEYDQIINVLTGEAP